MYICSFGIVHAWISHGAENTISFFAKLIYFLLERLFGMSFIFSWEEMNIFLLSTNACVYECIFEYVCVCTQYVKSLISSGNLLVSPQAL